jgi:RNA polymerase sigma factor (sigma-70 family)
MTDQALLEGIRRRDDEALAMLYRQFRSPIAAYLSQMGCNEENAKDIFQEAIVAVFLNVQKTDFQLKSSFSTYIHGICQNQWLKKIRNEKPNFKVSLDHQTVLTMPTDVLADCHHAERQLLFIEKLNEMPNNCRDLLQLAIVEVQSPETISAKLGFKSLKYYYKRKSKCKDSLIEMVRSDVRFFELINE